MSKPPVAPDRPMAYGCYIIELSSTEDYLKQLRAREAWEQARRRFFALLNVEKTCD